MTVNKFFPTLSSVVSVRSLPEELSFVEDGIENLLAGIFVKDIQTRKSANGEDLSYYLRLLIFKQVALTVPGTGFRILFNPADVTLNGYTEIPISISIHSEILKYIQTFSSSGFASSPIAIYKVICDILDIQEEALLENAMNVFSSANLNEFIVLLNEVNGLTNTVNEIPSSTSIEEVFDKITSSASNTGSSVFGLIFNILEDVNSIKETFNNIDRLFTFKLGTKPIDRIKQLLIPRVNATFDINLALEIPRKVLIPIKVNGEREEDENIKARLEFDLGEFFFGTDSGIGFDSAVTAHLPIAYPEVEIMNTGIKIGFSEAKIDLSRKTNLPEATAEGRPVDFIGVYIQNATVSFPINWSQSNIVSTGVVKGRNLLIGTGGITGNISLEPNNLNSSDPVLIFKKLGDFDVELNKIDIQFRQNAIVHSEVKGVITINGFKDSTNQPAKVNIKVQFGNSGDFDITASEDQGIDALTIPDVLKIRIKSLSFGQKNNRFYAAVSGFLDIIASVPGISIEGLPKNIEVKKLLIWEDGKIEIEGGALTLPRALAVKIGPVKLSLSAIHLGSKEQNGRQYNYFGFDGGVNVNPGGVDVQGNGIKFFYTTDDDLNVTPAKNPHRYLRIESIKVDIRIPGTAKEDKDTTFMLKGSLSMKNADAPNQNSNGTLADPTTEYIGSVTFKSNRLGVSGAVGMRLNPDVPAFLVDAELEFGDKGVMMGSTGLGLFGIRGLVGQKYGLDKSENEDWWQYYKRPDEGINIDKFKQKDGFSLGVGATLGTYNDQGKAFSTKVFLMLGLPDIFLIQGQAAILAEKRLQLGDTSDPPFSALISINKEAVRATLGVKMNKPDSGKIARLEGKADLAFFFNNSSGWYVNLGKDTPDHIIQNKEELKTCMKGAWETLPDLSKTSLMNDTIDLEVNTVNNGFKYNTTELKWQIDDWMFLSLNKRLSKYENTDVLRAGRLFLFHEGLHFCQDGHCLTEEIANGIGRFPKVIEEADYQADVWALLYEYRYQQQQNTIINFKKFFLDTIDTAVETMWSFVDNGSDLSEIQIRSMNRFLNWYWQWVRIERLSGNGELKEIIEILFDKPVIEFAGAEIITLDRQRTCFKLSSKPLTNYELAIFYKNKVYRFAPTRISKIVEGFRELSGNKIKEGLRSFIVTLAQ